MGCEFFVFPAACCMRRQDSGFITITIIIIIMRTIACNESSCAGHGGELRSHHELPLLLRALRSDVISFDRLERCSVDASSLHSKGPLQNACSGFKLKVSSCMTCIASGRFT